MKKYLSVLLILTMCLCLSCTNADNRTAEKQDAASGLQTADASGQASGTEPAAVITDVSAKNGAESEAVIPSDSEPELDVLNAAQENEAVLPAALSFHTEDQAKYLDGDYKLYKLYANGTDEKSIPEALVLESDGKSVQLSTDPAFPEESTVNVMASEDGNAYVYNLFSGTHYYCRVKDGGVITSVYVTNREDMRLTSADGIESFDTEALVPRNLYVPGLTNVRDLGGWSTSDGKTVKQGLLYRSSKLNADESKEALITDEGTEILTNSFGIKTELDLRTSEDNENGGLTESLAGPGVKYISIPIESGGNIILLNKDSLKDIFEVLGDEANYPILFHCSIGTDRTGMLAFLINGLLGVSEEDLYRDFLFSNFGNIGKMRTPSIIKTYIETVGNAQGSTLSEKIANYLISSGVDSEDIACLRSMMVAVYLKP